MGKQFDRFKNVLSNKKLVAMLMLCSAIWKTQHAYHVYLKGQLDYTNNPVGGFYMGKCANSTNTPPHSRQ